jgi:serine protease AprX
MLILIPFNSFYFSIPAEDTNSIQASTIQHSPFFNQEINKQDESTNIMGEAEPEQIIPSVRDKNKNKISDYLDSWIKKGYSRLDVMVVYSTDLTEYHINQLNELKVNIGEIFWTFDMVALREVPIGTIHKITQLPDVFRVENFGNAILYSDVATPAVKARESDLFSPNTAWELGYTGVGANIAVVDTGIDNGHPSLAGKWVGGVDLSKPEVPIFNPFDGTKDADDTNGHGTTCSGIATGTGAPDGVYMGAAPSAKLVDVRIGTMIGYAPGEGPFTFYDASLKGIEWSIEHKDDSWQGQGEENQGIDIISLSWGIDVGGQSDGSDIYSTVLDRAVDAGIIVAHAAGNSGPNNNGFDGFAAASNGISVASSDDLDTIERTDDIIAEYSSRGPRHDNGDGNPYNELKPDVTAPGTHINQVQFDVFGDGSGNGYGSRGSGTSYAAPVVAGICAMMLEANPKITPELTREILHLTSERRGEPTVPEVDPFWNRDFGYGIVDAYKAVKLSAELTDIDAIDVNLQCFITEIETGENNITTGTAAVRGIAFSKTGNLEKIELSVDNGSWRTVGNTQEDGIYSLWSYDLDTSELDNGNHTVRVRALSSSSQSLEDSREITTQNKKQPPSGLTNEQLTISIAIVLVLAVVAGVYFYNKKKKNIQTNNQS